MFRFLPIFFFFFLILTVTFSVSVPHFVFHNEVKRRRFYCTRQHSTTAAAAAAAAAAADPRLHPASAFTQKVSSLGRNRRLSVLTPGEGGGGAAVETTFAPTLWKSETVIAQSGFQSSNSLRRRVGGERFFPLGKY